MKSLQTISRMAMTMLMVCLVAVAFGQVKEKATIATDAHIDAMLELKVTGGDVKFHIDTKDKYKKGMEANGTKVEICASCDWKLKYDLHTNIEKPQGSNEWAVKGMKGHYLPIKLIGMMIKPKNPTWFNAHIQNLYAQTKPLSRWDTMLMPKAGKSNIGDFAQTGFDIWWSLGNTAVGNGSLLQNQIHADWYKFKVHLTLMCLE